MPPEPWLPPSVSPPVATTAQASVVSSAGRSKPILRKDHPCATAFLDESGIISKDRFFSIGLLKSKEPARLLRALQKLRDQQHWYSEIKWYDLTKGTIPFYKRVVDLLGTSDAEFFCFVSDRSKDDPVTRFGSTWDAYRKLAEQLVVASIHPDELVALMADSYSTPDSVLFEEELRAGVNRRLSRLALTSVVRLDSRSSDGLQAADLLTSAITHEFRVSAGLASSASPKGEVAEYVRAMLGASSCLAGWRNAAHSVQIYRTGK